MAIHRIHLLPLHHPVFLYGSIGCLEFMDSNIVKHKLRHSSWHQHKNDGSAGFETLEVDVHERGW